MAYVKNWDDVKVKQTASGNAAGQTAAPVQQPNGIAGDVPKQTVYNSTPTAVRDTMVNQYGLDNNKIGWDGANVLYDGNVFLKPDYVDDNGVSFASGSSIYNAVANLGANSQTAVRSGLGRYGLDMDELGMENGQVTYGGKSYLTPDRVENGVSYVDNPNDLMGMAMQVYRDNGQDIVRLTDYVSNTQLPFSVNYQNGMVSVGGQMIQPAFVLDGKAYVDRSALDAAVAKAQDAAGIQNKQDIWQKYDDRYGGMYEDLADRLYNREAFSYNPETDPAYEAYRDMYMREGDRAMRDAMGAAQAASGGYMNSAAATAAAQQNNYYTQQLNDRVPELMQFAYQRYADDFTRDRQALSDIMGLDNQQFNREYGVNNDIINDIRYNNQLNEARDDKAYDRYWNEKVYHDEQEWNQKYYDIDSLNSAENRAATNASTEAQKLQNILTRAIQTNTWPAGAENYFDTSVEPREYAKWMTDEELRGYQGKSDIDLAANKELGAFNTQQQKDLASYNAGLDWDLYQKQYGLESGEKNQVSMEQQIKNANKLVDSINKSPRVTDYLNAINDANPDNPITGGVIQSIAPGQYQLNTRLNRDEFIPPIIDLTLLDTNLSWDEKINFLHSLGVADSEIYEVMDYMGYEAPS